MDSSLQRELEEKINAGSKITDDFFNLGDLYFFKGMFEQMLQTLDRLRSLQLTIIDQAHLHQQEGEAYWALGMHQKAEASYRKSIEILEQPQNSFECLYLLGR
ncbi:MAG: tetratricopeptide repeat protein [Syntrophobacteraceae bacterium]